MAIGDISVTIRDGALGLSSGSRHQFGALVGVCNTGAFEWAVVRDSVAVRALCDEGPLADAAEYILLQPDVEKLWIRPINAWGIRNLTKTVAGGDGVMNANGSNPTKRHNADIVIDGAGELGTATFKWRLQPTDAYTATVAIPDGDPITLAEGVQVAFTDGTPVSFQVGDTWTFRSDYDSTATVPSKTAAGITDGTLTLPNSYPFDSYLGQVKIIKAGAAGTATFKISLDNGVNWSDEYVTPSSGTAYTGIRAKTGLELVFTDGTPDAGFTAGDLWTFSTTAPGYSAGNLDAAIDEIKDDNSIVPGVVHVLGSTSASVVASMATKAGAAETAHNYYRMLLEGRDYDSGTDSNDNVDYATNLDSEIGVAQTNSARLAVTAGFCDLDLKGGWIRRTARKSLAWPLMARLCSMPFSVDAGRVRDGSLADVKKIHFDARKYSTLEDKGFTVARTYDNRTGFYIQAGIQHTLPSSDYYYTVDCRVMDVSCDRAYQKALDFINWDVLVDTATGIIEESQAVMVESAIRRFVLNVLHTNSIRHVSDFQVTVDRTENILSTNNITLTIRVIKKGYIRTFKIDIGFLNPGAV